MAGTEAGRPPRGPQLAPRPHYVFDVVCGLVVDARRTPYTLEHANRTYVFCGANCQHAFAAHPERYLGSRVYGPFH